jgi:hypothetical protein
MSEVLLRFRGREVTQADAASLRELIAQHPKASRRRLSELVCAAWQWHQPNGQPRDSVCRTLMLALHRAGHIQLPPPRFRAINNAVARRVVQYTDSYDAAPFTGTLADLGPLEYQLVRRCEAESLFAHLLSRYHYLGYRRPVGEHLKYLIYAGLKPIACFAWSSAPRQLDLRDQYVGAPKQAYRHNLNLIAYNSRFLVVPWIQVPHLASHLLGRLARRLSADWEACYGHPVHLLESFVDTEHFEGVCYKAANWQLVGYSQGRGTRSKSSQPGCSIKALWMYSLRPDFRERLLAP